MPDIYHITHVDNLTSIAEKPIVEIKPEWYY